MGAFAQWLAISSGVVCVALGTQFLPLPRWAGVAAVPTSRPLPAYLRPITLQEGAVIVCEGDSLTRGTDRVESLATLFRSEHPDTPYPSVLASILGHGVRIVNQGHGGDTAADGLSRWAGRPSGDLSIIMYGGNDARIRWGGLGHIPIAAFRRTMGELIERRKRQGATVLVMAPPQIGTRAAERAIAPYRDASRQAAIDAGALFVDARQFLATEALPFKLDGVHLRPSASRRVAIGLSTLIQIRSGGV